MESSKPIKKHAIEDYISDSTQIQLNSKAPIDNPSFTGTVSIPNLTAPVGELNNIVINDAGTLINIPIESATAGNFKIAVTNKTGVSIPKGSAIYINGAQGSKATIALAIADPNIATSLSIGITETTIANNASGYAVALGEIASLNTSTFANGDKLFLSATTPGGLVNISPISPNNVIFIGTVINAHNTQGKILINVLYTFKLDSLTDTAITTPTDNQVLTYEASSGLWKNKTSASGGTPTTRVLNINGNSLDLSNDREWRVAQGDTGALTYSGISIASTTTVNIGACKGYVINNESNPLSPTFTYIDYPGESNKTVTTIGSGIITYVLLQSNGSGGGTILFQNTQPTSAQRKSYIWLSKLSHPNSTSLSLATNEVDFINSPLAQFRDFFQAITYVNEGIVISPNGVNLNINLSAGKIIGDGINFVVDRTNPNYLTINSQTPAQFIYRNRNGGTSGFITTIDPTTYDNAGTTTSITGGTNLSTNQYIFYIPGIGLGIQRGQQVYNTLSESIAAIGREQFTIFPNFIKNSILIGVISLRHTAIDLSDINFARFFIADKFGQTVGSSAGISTGTLQSAYNNSSDPEIVTDSIRNGLTIKRGSSADTDNILEIQNGAGTTTASVRGNGEIYSVTASPGTNTTQIATTAFVVVADSGNVKLTGNQTIAGIKTFNTVGSGFSGGTGHQAIYNTTNGVWEMSTTTAKPNIYFSDGGTTVGAIFDGYAGSTGYHIIGKLNNITNFTLDKDGSITAYNYSGGATLTGAPTAPTATIGTNTTQIATTAFVLANNGAASSTHGTNLSPTAVSNTSATSQSYCHWIKQGNVVTVIFEFTCTVTTANTDSEIDFNIPVTRVNTSADTVGTGAGKFFSNLDIYPAIITMLNNTSTARIIFRPKSSGANSVSGQFTYYIN